MCNLLADNIALHDHLHGYTTSLNPRQRKVPSLALWVYFAAYMAVLMEELRTRDMLANCHLIIHEAPWHGGSDWHGMTGHFGAR